VVGVIQTCGKQVDKGGKLMFLDKISSLLNVYIISKFGQDVCLKNIDMGKTP